MLCKVGDAGVDKNKIKFYIMRLVLSRKNFSSKKKGRENESSGISELSGAGGVVLVGSKASKASNKYFNNKLKNGKIDAKDEKAISEALKKKAASQGIGVVDLPDFNNSAYVGGKSIRKAKENTKKKLGIDKLRKHGKHKQADAIEKYLDKTTGGLYKHLGEDKVVLGKGHLSKADALSHELGHAQYAVKGRSKNIIAKAAHSAYAPSKVLSTPNTQGGKGINILKSHPGAVISATNGFVSGIKAEKAKQRGEKESNWNKISAVAVPAAMAAPMLIAEAAASRKGLKMMKEAGASKELMKQSRRRLGAALGSYATMPGINVAAGVGGRLAGKGLMKLENHKDSD